MGGSYQQEVDLHSLFKDVAGEFVETVTVAEQLPNVLDRAIRTAMARSAPTAVIVPADVQELELITINRYWREWDDPRLVIAILHNNDLNQVTWEMRSLQGAPKFPDSQTLPDVDYAAFATSLGLAASTIRSPAELPEAWDSALAADRPTVLDVYCDPDVPPIPPHASWDQINKTAKSLWKGDEDRWGVLKEGVKTKLQELRH